MNGAIASDRRSGTGGGFGQPSGMLMPLSYALVLPRNVPPLRHDRGQLRDRRVASAHRQHGRRRGSLGRGRRDETDADALHQRASRGVDGNSPQPLVPGTPFVDRGTKPTGSPTYPLDVLAAYSSDRKKFLVSVVNPTEERQSVCSEDHRRHARRPGHALPDRAAGYERHE